LPREIRKRKGNSEKEGGNKEGKEKRGAKKQGRVAKRSFLDPVNH
jgi:hypothetical protein